MENIHEVCKYMLSKVSVYVIRMIYFCGGFELKPWEHVI